MKTQIRKKIFTIAVLITTLFAFSQGNNRFYASIEDYQNNKFIEGYEIDYSYSGSENFKVKINGGEPEKMKISKFPSDFYVYDGVLLRRFDNHSYFVLVNGFLCYYVMKEDADVSKVKGNFEYRIQGIEMFDQQGRRSYKDYKVYYSEKITGEIKKLKGEIFEKYLTQYSLFDSYEKEKPKREFKDNKQDYNLKEVIHDVKIIKAINEKAK